ncbi:unnamed protein product (macronuclear) [Paramecium tetraurelia]|uniref:Uncharacterized protein n=1 Tax=Paramecium tetraurelia TaxID=5888 RepID=A0BQ82_PARTE|nr:uncharacterized protein GSPATT00005450001 [Paramecium tetraurelia]CAK60699.1 unnamed protein product [Paramecium tetraurelia]|eukprot:XP_001428097.1 hypothetical protein (macronuclear) [Paramecium tetraurelia strain d4-2]
MNYSTFSFSQLGKQILQENKDIQDQLTLELLNNYRSGSFFKQASENRLAQQIEKQNQIINMLMEKQEPARFNNPIEFIKKGQQQYQEQTRDKYQNFSQIQLMQPLPLPPPPIFMPSNFSFMQQQQAERQQQEKLRMLLLMKKLKEENFSLKMKLSERGEQPEKSFESYSNSQSQQQSSKKSEKQYKQQKRNLGPTQEDYQKEIRQLEQLLSKRAIAQLKIRSKRLTLMLSFIRKTKQLIELKSSQFQDKFPENILQFQNECFKWMKDFTNIIVDKLKQQNSNVSLYLDTKVNPKEAQKRMDQLKIYVKNFIDALFDNQASIPKFCKEYLLYFTFNFFCTPANFLLKFEINRLSFTPQGGTILNQRQSQMMIITIIIIRMYLQFLNDLWEPIPASSSSTSKKANQQYRLNIQSICSVIYYLALEVTREMAAIQRDNLKLVSNDFQPKVKSGGVIRMKNFEEREVDKTKQESLKDGDEPLVHPIFDKSELNPFFKDNSTIQSLKSTIEGWSENIYYNLQQCIKEISAEKKHQFENGEKLLLIQKIQDNKQQTEGARQLRQIQNSILEQKEKIAQMKKCILCYKFIVLNVSTNKKFEHSEQEWKSKSKQSNLSNQY